MTVEFYGRYSAFVMALLLGLFFGLLYDVFRIIRVSRMPYIVPEGRLYDMIKIPSGAPSRFRKATRKLFSVSDALATFAEDILFWITVSVCEILFVYHVNGGVVRIYFIIYSFLGAALYFFTLGKLTMYFAVRIVFLSRCTVYWTVRIIICPIRFILTVSFKCLRFIASVTLIPVINIIKKRASYKYSQKRISRILAESKKGFL